MKSIPHADLITKTEVLGSDGAVVSATVALDGMTKLLKAVTDAVETEKAVAEAVTDAVETEKAVAETDEFDRTPYDAQIWRRRGDSMQQFIARRNADFKKLNDIVTGDPL